MPAAARPPFPPLPRVPRPRRLSRTPRSAGSSSLLRDAGFRWFRAGGTASQLGEQAGRTVLPLLAVVSLHSGPGELGALRAVEQAPIPLLSLLVGAGVDRRRSRRVMVLAGLGRAAVPAAVPLAYLLGGLAAHHGLRSALLAAAAALILSPLYLACSPLARLGRNLPAPAADPGGGEGPAEATAGRTGGTPS